MINPQIVLLFLAMSFVLLIVMGRVNDKYSYMKLILTSKLGWDIMHSQKQSLVPMQQLLLIVLLVVIIITKLH